MNSPMDGINNTTYNPEPQVTVIPSKPRPVKRLRVAAYARVSEDNTRPQHSLSAQVSHYQDLIGANPRWDFAGIYTDLGRTGTNTRRPGFQDLMAACRDGLIDVVLTKSVSRLARNTVDLLATCRELTALGVEVRFERENISTATSDGELMLSLLASFAQAESESNSQAVKWATRKRLAQGIPNGFKQYGYINHGEGHIDINPREAKIVRLVFDNYLAGISPETTARDLAAQGVKGPQGVPFDAMTLRSWLGQERFTGTLILQKSYVPKPGGREIKNDGVLPMYVVEDAIPAIIPKEIFDQVQAERARRRALGAKANRAIPTTALTSKIWCEHCGKTLRARSWKRWDETIGKAWRCVEGPSNNPTKGCPTPSIHDNALRETLTSLMEWDAYSEDLVETEIERISVAPDRTITIRTHEAKTLSSMVVQQRYESGYWDDPSSRKRAAKSVRDWWDSLSEAEREARAAKARGRTHTEESKDKIRRKWTPERRARQAQIAREVNAKRWAAHNAKKAQQQGGADA